MLHHTITDQSPFFIILNAGSGKDDSSQLSGIIRAVFSESNHDYHITIVDDPKTLSSIAKENIQKALDQHGVVVIGGGDGAINAIVQEALPTGCPVGILPQGTFNYFGRTHQISEDTETATKQLLTGNVQPVQVGQVNGKIFLVNASLGLYPDLLEERESYKQHYGRSRFVAMIAGIITLLHKHRILRISVEKDGTTKNLRTPTLFVGNNRLQLEQIGIPEAEATEAGELSAIMLKPVSNLRMIWLMLRGALGSLAADKNIVHFSFKDMRVKQFSLRRKTVKIATDGEICKLKTPLHFGVTAQPLYLIKPDSSSAQ